LQNTLFLIFFIKREIAEILFFFLQQTLALDHTKPFTSSSRSQGILLGFIKGALLQPQASTTSFGVKPTPPTLDQASDLHFQVSSYSPRPKLATPYVRVEIYVLVYGKNPIFRS